jgi:hypothetical protein
VQESVSVIVAVIVHRLKLVTHRGASRWLAIRKRDACATAVARRLGEMEQFDMKEMHK